MKLTSILLFTLFYISAWAQNTNEIDSLNIEADKFLDMNDSIEAAKLYYKIGKIYFSSGDNNTAMLYFEKTLNYADSALIILVYNQMGGVHIRKGELDKTMDLYKKAVVIAEESGNKKYEGMMLNNIGFLYSEYDNQSKALEYYEKGLEKRLEVNDTKGIAKSYNSIGRTHFQLGNFEEANKFYEKSLEVFENEGFDHGAANVLNNIGNVYLKMDDLKNALTYHNKALKLRSKIDDLRGLAESYKNLTKIYLQKKDCKNAEITILKGIQYSKETSSIRMLNKFYYQLFNLYKTTGNTDLALNYYVKYTRIKDSLFSVESENRISELEIQYQTEKKEKQIEILNQETEFQKQKLKNQRLLLTSVIIIIVFVILLGILYFRQNKLKSELKVEQNKQKLLRSQMNPHFIYNSLSAIQNFILSNDSMESVTYISEFSSLMRMVLENSRKDLITLKEDIDFVNFYLKLQKLRFSDKFDYLINVDEKINQETIKIPPMLTQPFIENAVEHGMRQIEKDGMIQLNYQIENNDLVISVIDNGKGLNEKTESKHKSLATTITKERIENILKLLKVKIEMDIVEAFPESENKGLKVEFRIPQIK